VLGLQTLGEAATAQRHELRVQALSKRSADGGAGALVSASPSRGRDGSVERPAPPTHRLAGARRPGIDTGAPGGEPPGWRRGGGRSHDFLQPTVPPQGFAREESGESRCTPSSARCC
jgi:hypothetical protein